MGDYACCGVKSFPLCPSELSFDALIQWCSIGYEVVGHNEDGKEKKAPKIEFCEMPPRELIFYLKPKLEKVVLHNLLARWQGVQFKELLETMPSGSIISCIDFSNNYTMRVQNLVMTFFILHIKIL